MIRQKNKASVFSIFLIIGLLLVWTALRVLPAAKAAPVTPSATPVLSMTELLAGTRYPNTLKSAQIDTSYYLINLVDMQGKPGAYATKGETVSLAGENFLVTYYVPLSVAPTRPPLPKPDTIAQLTLINLHYTQAIIGIQAITKTPKTDDQPTVPAAPEVK